MVRTEGSTVGDGVPFSTSRSMTLFWSLPVRRLVSGAPAQENDCPVNQPFLKSPNAFHQVSSCLVLGVGDGGDAEIGERMAQHRAQVVWKVGKGVIAALEAVDEA